VLLAGAAALGCSKEQAAVRRCQLGEKPSASNYAKAYNVNNT
jgi:hypothetical protein